MAAEKENDVKLEEKIESNSLNKLEDKQEKLISIPILLAVSAYLIIAFAISWYLGVKQKNELLNKEPEVKEEIKQNKEEKKEETQKPIILDEIKLNIDDVRGKEFLDYITYTLHNVYIDSADHLIPDDQRNSVNLLQDSGIEFKFIYYLLERYGDKEQKKYNTNINGLYESGAYAIKYNYFKEFYKEVMGKNFNEEVLSKVGNLYRINGEYLYGKVVTSLNPKYSLSNESFSQIGDKYYYTIFIEELDSNKETILSYKIKFCISIVNEKFMLNSIVVY